MPGTRRVVPLRADAEVCQWVDAGDMTRQQVPVLRVAIGALALVALVLQVLVVPLVAAACAAAYPDVAYLERPYVAAVVVALVGFEVALLSAWQLLRVPAEAGPTMRWANALAGSLCFMAVVLAGLSLHAAFVANVGGPLTMLGLLVCVAVVPIALALRHRAVKFSLRGRVDQAPLGHAH